MSPDRIVLNHLLEGRQALVTEVERLTAAIRDLDVVIDRVSDGDPVGSRPAADDFEPVTGRALRTTRSRSARKPAGRRSATRRAATVGGDGQKSIRILVLEMLAAEERDFGLAEIIDRIHAAGIDAHDDAVRSITIKLMKDGRVERVGRGQYRLAAHLDDRADAPTNHEPTDHEPTDHAPTNHEPTNHESTDHEPADDGPAAPGASEHAQPTALNLAQAWDAPRA